MLKYNNSFKWENFIFYIKYNIDIIKIIWDLKDKSYNLIITK